MSAAALARMLLAQRPASAAGAACVTAPQLLPPLRRQLSTASGAHGGSSVVLLRPDAPPAGRRRPGAGRGDDDDEASTEDVRERPMRRPAPRRGARAPTFVDRVRIEVAAGHGGAGIAAFTRGPNAELAPPDGGDGGHGGSVWLEADADITSLRMWRRSVRAENGHRGASALRKGRTGNDIVIRVPPGTVARFADRSNPSDSSNATTSASIDVDLDADFDSLGLELHVADAGDRPGSQRADETQHSVYGHSHGCYHDHQSDSAMRPVLCDLDRHGKSAQIARGGLGGRGNASFKSSRNRSPTRAQPGTPGERLLVDLELKSIADVGLVGYPNAGKSTLLRAISRAKPKVASYPFTTMRPHIGVVVEPPRPDMDMRRITVADIPGLVEGAHDNRGLGHEFLRHVERTSVLVFVLDMSEGLLGREGLDVLIHELELYEPGLSRRPACIAANKMDVGIHAFDALRSLIKEVDDALPIFPISARECAGTGDLTQFLVDTVHAARGDMTEPHLSDVHLPKATKISAAL